jgi:sugar lactone lactonase YvrE
MRERHANTSVIDGLLFPEGLRWRDNKLWFCDIASSEVITAEADGAILERRSFPGEHPIGIAWTPDGELVVTGRYERLLMYADGAPVLLQDLCDGDQQSWANDLVIDSVGRTYISSFGRDYDLTDHASNVERLKGVGRVLLRETDGSFRAVASGLSMPNTMQLTPDGKTLIVSDSMANRVVSYEIGSDGTLSSESLVHQFDSMVDGSTLDAEGALWVCLPHENAAKRLLDGEITDIVHFNDEVFDVTLGGRQGTTMFAAVSNLTAAEPVPEGHDPVRPGHIYAIEVDVPAPSEFSHQVG